MTLQSMSTTSWRPVAEPRDAQARVTITDQLETLLAGIVVIMLTSPGLLLMGASDAPNAPENPAFRLYWAPAYAIILGLAAWRAPRLRRAWPALALCAVLCGWAFASVNWSIDAAMTSRRAVALGVTTLFGLYLGSALDEDRRLKLLAGGLTLLALGSVATALLAPRFGIDHRDNPGDWRGLWAEKNTLALYMALGGVACLSAAFGPQRRRGLWLVAFGLCTLILLLSRGKTSLLCLALAAVAICGLAVARCGRIAALLCIWSVVTAGAVSAFVGFAAPDALLKSLGKDPTLTGRTQIWAAVTDQAARHPLLGFGYAAFWGPTSVPAAIVRKQVHWPAPTAHNGWLDVLVQVGWIGVTLCGGVFVINVVANGVRTARTRELFALPFLIVFGVLSLTESVLEQQNSLIWVLFVAVLTQAISPPPRARAGTAAFPAAHD